jgi:hypothetical protein
MCVLLFYARDETTFSRQQNATSIFKISYKFKSKLLTNTALLGKNPRFCSTKNKIEGKEK